MKFIERLAKLKIIKALASVKITVVCLFLLFVLTFWGTVAQVDHGLYDAQERYFASLFFLVFGFIPFPGAQLILWILFINLACVTITRFVHYFKPHYAGLLIVHFGLLIYLFSAFVIFHVSKESNVHLMEHEGTNVSASYHEWELAFWTETGDKRNVTAYDTAGFASGTRLKFEKEPFEIMVKQYYPNSQAYTAPPEGKSRMRVKNDSGIALLEPKDILKERERNMAGGIFEIHGSGIGNTDVLLYGGDTKPTTLKVGDKTYFFRLHHKKSRLPLTIELLDFRAQFHPGTETAKSYESTVRITHDGASREVVVAMNKPLRYKDFTFFQASYAIDSMGNEYSTFAVVQNVGRFLPYVASLMTFFGLSLHFLTMAFASRSQKKSNE